MASPRVGRRADLDLAGVARGQRPAAGDVADAYLGLRRGNPVPRPRCASPRVGQGPAARRGRRAARGAAAHKPSQRERDPPQTCSASNNLTARACSTIRASRPTTWRCGRRPVQGECSWGGPSSTSAFSSQNPMSISRYIEPEAGRVPERAGRVRRRDIRDEGHVKPGRLRADTDLAFKLGGAVGRAGLMETPLGLKPDWRKVNVRNFRGGAGDVGYGRTRNPLHHRKSEDRSLSA